jgi:hypothetical protein
VPENAFESNLNGDDDLTCKHRHTEIIRASLSGHGSLSSYIDDDDDDDAVKTRIWVRPESDFIFIFSLTWREISLAFAVERFQQKAATQNLFTFLVSLVF